MPRGGSWKATPVLVLVVDVFVLVEKEVTVAAVTVMS